MEYVPPTGDVVYDFFIAVLNGFIDVVAALLDVLPNPDPFPAMIDDLVVQGGDVVAVAYYWLDAFFVADAVVQIFTAWFALFALAWVIQWLWRLIRVR